MFTTIWHKAYTSCAYLAQTNLQNCTRTYCDMIQSRTVPPGGPRESVPWQIRHSKAAKSWPVSSNARRPPGAFECLLQHLQLDPGAPHDTQEAPPESPTSGALRSEIRRYSQPMPIGTEGGVLSHFRKTCQDKSAWLHRSLPGHEHKTEGDR